MMQLWKIIIDKQSKSEFTMNEISCLLNLFGCQIKRCIKKKNHTVIEQRDAVTILKIILLGCFYTSGITDSLSSLFFLL